MRDTFRGLLQDLRRVANRYDAESNTRKQQLLAALGAKRLPPMTALADYCHVLMFLCAHPAGEALRQGAESELERVAQFLRRAGRRRKAPLENSGLPFTRTLCTYSHDLLRWMTAQAQYDVSFDSLHHPTVPLKDALRCTLPSLERDAAGAGGAGRQLLAAFAGPRERWVPFLLQEFGRLDDQPLLKDFLFDGLHLYVALTPRDRTFSLAFNRIEQRRTWYHQDLLRDFDRRGLLEARLPPPVRLSPGRQAAVVASARNAMILLQRETDPTTYMDPRSLRLYALERGLQVAIYGMVPARQLPLESYIGYTLYKNGLPAAYGGSWIFGRRALFGINIFEPFRGGESSFVLCQLLRVYRQAFGIDYFEIEPYQFGENNPEGIRSGAYWFYDRHGFRPLDPGLRRLADGERRKIAARKGYRSPVPVLKQFATGNVALNLGKAVPPRVADVREQVTAHIRDRFGGDRPAAEAACRREFVQRAGRVARLNAAQDRVFSEVALWAAAARLRSPEALALLQRMIRVKPVDPYSYQRLLLELLP